MYVICNLPDWSKVHAGLLRLFQGEVLNKLPVVQHIPFGTLLRCSWTPHVPVGSADRSTTGTTLLTEDQVRQIQARSTVTVTGVTGVTGVNAGIVSRPTQDPAGPSMAFEAQTRAPWARK